MQKRSSARCRSTGTLTILTRKLRSSVEQAGRSSSLTARRTRPALSTSGTAWNKIIKDSILRYYRMCGRNVIDRAGYDMHGLPIEVKVEQALGFASKKDIEKYGIQEFIEKCREFAVTNKLLMDKQFESLGVWLDFTRCIPDRETGIYRGCMVDARPGTGEGDARARQPGRELVPPVRDGDRGRRGRVLGRERPLGFREVPAQGKTGRVPRDLDDDPVDPPRKRRGGGGKRLRVRPGVLPKRTGRKNISGWPNPSSRLSSRKAGTRISRSSRRRRAPNSSGGCTNPRSTGMCRSSGRSSTGS